MHRLGLVVLLGGGTSLVAAACGRGPLEPPAGSAGGVCYGNGTCDDGLFCGPGDECVSEAVFTCDGVECSGHGTCSLAGGRPACVCQVGFRSFGLACVPCATPDCTGTDGCPDEMVWVGFGADGVCVDRYEASLFANPDCTGTRYGVAGVPDLPAGFPPDVECRRCDTSRIFYSPFAPASEEVYACSMPGLRPAVWVSWLQATRSCENVGKRLCDAYELTQACAGPNGWDYPYGEVSEHCACNEAGCGPAEPAVTGGFPACEGGVAGLFDVLGNVGEWTATVLSTDQPELHGEGYLGVGLVCGYTFHLPVAWESMADLGFRCCKAL